MKIPHKIIYLLEKCIGKEWVFVDKETLINYGHDETEDLSFPPQVLVKPSTAKEISEIMKIAYKYNVSVTPIGAKTGLSGGALSVCGGIGLSVERLNKIIKIDEKNLQVTVEPGVITQVLKEAVAKKELFYPVDPSSMGSCFIGGNIAENSGGARAVKYGVTKDYILNLEVVLANGEIIQTGANTLKNATGYNITQLMIGSEGTLGIVTKAVIKLLPENKYNMLLLIPFYKSEEACKAVATIFNAKITPSALEFMERDAIDWTLRYIDDVNIPIHSKIQAHLLVEVDGNNLDVLMQDAEKIVEVVDQYQIDEILFADSFEQKEALWKIRRAVGEAVKSNSIYKEEDTVVPRYQLPNLLQGVKKIGKKYGFTTICYGHAGDGNLHINIIKGDLPEEKWKKIVPKGIKEIFTLTVELKGTLSGEHGIGYVQKEYMPIAFTQKELDIMKGIKKVFDPKGILNPKKIFPEK